MDMMRIMSALETSIKPRFYKYVSESTNGTCDACLKHGGEIFTEYDKMPELPLHPNCRCHYIEVSVDDFLKQKTFEFGTMGVDKWLDQSEDDKNLWCNSFRNRFGEAIDKYAQKYNVPKELLAGISANEMLDWKWPDGSWLDGVGGGGVGFAQIAPKTARKEGIEGRDYDIKKKLKTTNGSVEIAAKILKNNLDELKTIIAEDKLGKGFEKSTLYYLADPAILNSKDKVDMKVPEWLLNTMCAVWNSGTGVLKAKEKIGDDNYRNACRHGSNSSVFQRYLSKLVK
ncbi:MAG: hypothetical protein AB7F32_03500 [Victivallaceae bacterium]